MKQNANATESATSVIGGNSVLFRSGQGRCSRPDIAAIFAASQRLSVKRHHGERSPTGRRKIVISACDPAFDFARRAALKRRKGLQQPAAQRFGGGLGALAEHQRHGGNRGQCGKACDPEQDAADRIPFELRCSRRRTIAGGGIGQRPSQQREMAEPPGRQRHGDRKGDAIAQAENRRRSPKRPRCRRSLRRAVPIRAPPPSAAAAPNRKQQ